MSVCVCICVVAYVICNTAHIIYLCVWLEIYIKSAQVWHLWHKYIMDYAVILIFVSLYCYQIIKLVLFIYFYNYLFERLICIIFICFLFSLAPTSLPWFWIWEWVGVIMLICVVIFEGVVCFLKIIFKIKYVL